MLQSVPVLIHSVSSPAKPTLARGAPCAVTSGSRNFAASSGGEVGHAGILVRPMGHWRRAAPQVVQPRGYASTRRAGNRLPRAAGHDSGP